MFTLFSYFAVIHNIEHGYSLEVLTRTHDPLFLAKNKKSTCHYYLKMVIFTTIKIRSKLHSRVNVMYRIEDLRQLEIMRTNFTGFNVG